MLAFKQLSYRTPPIALVNVVTSILNQIEWHR
jgi:hypothetical protein